MIKTFQLVLILLLAVSTSVAGAQDRADTSRVQQTDWDTVKRKAVAPGLTRRYIYGGTTTMAIFDYKKGARVLKHSHANEQVSYIQSGRVRVIAGGRTYMVGPGETLIIPPYVPHCFEALEETVNIDFFAPAREDWISGQDTYLRSPGTP